MVRPATTESNARTGFRIMTAPISTPPTCSVWVDGIRMADGQPGEPDDAPCVLTDLKITWGRATTIDQPVPGSATFKVLDLAGGLSFLDVIRLGSAVGIRTEGTVWEDPTVPMLPEGFGPALYWNAAHTTAGGSVTVSPILAGTDGMLVLVPPAALSSDPSAWNDIPRSKAHQTWQLTGSVTLQTDLGTVRQMVKIRPVYYSNPDGVSAVLGEPILTIGPGLTGPHPFSVAFTPADDVWVGIRYEIWPTGPRWMDLAASPSWASLGAHPTWAELATATLGAPTLLAPAAGVSKTALVFSGHVTDLIASYDTSIGGTVVDVIASDYMADLANRYVGDVPWGAEALGPRFDRILSVAGQTINHHVDPAPAALSVSYRDVDNQPVARLLQELAISAAGVLWSATNLVTGEFLWLEDIGNRVALNILTKDPDGWIRVHPADASVTGAVTISACSLLLEPVEWEQTYADYSTQVGLTWLDQVVDPGPPAVIKPTSREITVTDVNSEALTGRRRLSVSTQLSHQTEAQTIASTILGRLRVPGWRVSGLTWEMGPHEPLTQAELGVMLTILDGTTRIGLPILLTDVPPWSPMGSADQIPLYLEGARLSNHNGYWKIELLTSDAHNQGVAAIPWTALPVDWLWTQFDPSVTWDALAGVGIE